MSADRADGLYQVTTRYLCAGFVVERGGWAMELMGQHNSRQSPGYFPALLAVLRKGTDDWDRYASTFMLVGIAFVLLSDLYFLGLVLLVIGYAIFFAHAGT